MTGADLAVADGDFEAVYVTGDGTECRVDLAALGGLRLEDGRPARSFPSYRGQRNYPGWYWSATMGRRVGFESWAERDHLVAVPARQARQFYRRVCARLGDGTYQAPADSDPLMAWAQHHRSDSTGDHEEPRVGERR